MKVRLDNAPVGLFKSEIGTICLKTEYGEIVTDEKGTFIKVDAYIVDTGEYFWGGAETSRARNDLLVTPLYIEDGRIKESEEKE